MQAVLLPAVSVSCCIAKLRDESDNSPCAILNHPSMSRWDEGHMFTCK